jgi:type II secretory pathway pseudopilin PulG
MPSRSKGFTVTELVVTVAIIMALLAISTYTFYDALPGIRVKATARELYGNLQKARLTAMSTSATIAVTLSASANSYTLGGDTIPMNTANPGVQFGAVTGTTPCDATRGLDDGIAIPADGTLPVDKFGIDRRGRPSKDGEIYLIHRKDLATGRKDRTYCIAIRQIGTYRLLHYNGTSWE